MNSTHGEMDMETETRQEIDRQLEILTGGTVDLISREELGRKIGNSLRTGQPLRIKLGADPSAPDLHLGHCVALNKLRQFQECGHLVVFIIGDFTGMIGDPSGKSATRPALTREVVQANAETYKEQVFKILDRDRTEIRYNSEWHGPMTFGEVLRLSAQVTVAQMLAREDFSQRYGNQQPISLVEFLYPLVQAYDSVMVKADLELGGTDQLFNLLMGRDIQQAHGMEPQVVMTLPLLEGLDGVQKMSKSLGNYIGVNEIARDMYGKAMSISDDLMWRYFELVLDMPPSEREPLRQSVESGRAHPRDVKDRLARGIVQRFHGETAADTAAAEFKRIFTERQLPDTIPEYSITTLPLCEGRIGILDLLRETGLSPSNKESRRLLQQGAITLDDTPVTDPFLLVTPQPDTILRVGKRRFLCLRK